MTGLREIAGVGLIAASVSLGVGVIPQAGGQTPAEREQVTTDTPEFCAHLIALMREALRVRLPPPPQEVVSRTGETDQVREVNALSSEGERMCAAGDIRRGVLRLRQAMRLLMNGPAPAPLPIPQ